MSNTLDRLWLKYILKGNWWNAKLIAVCKAIIAAKGEGK